MEVFSLMAPYPAVPSAFYSSFISIANAALKLHNKSRKMEDLEEAITFYREALTLCPLGQPDSFAPLNKLSCAVLTRFQHTAHRRRR